MQGITIVHHNVKLNRKSTSKRQKNNNCQNTSKEDKDRLGNTRIYNRFKTTKVCNRHLKKIEEVRNRHKTTIFPQ